MEVVARAGAEFVAVAVETAVFAAAAASSGLLVLAAIEEYSVVLAAAAAFAGFVVVAVIEEGHIAARLAAAVAVASVAAAAFAPSAGVVVRAEATAPGWTPAKSACATMGLCARLHALVI